MKKSTPGICSTFCWTRIEAKRNAFSILVRPSFGILLAGWRFFICSFSFDRVIHFRSSIATSEVLLDEELLGLGMGVGSEK